MKFIYQIVVSGFILLFYSCSNNIPKEVEQALHYADQNREEIEKVIDHYKNGGDSLKLEAAYFLIKNIYAKIILGSTFLITDLIAYSLGVLTVLIIDNKLLLSQFTSK